MEFLIDGFRTRPTPHPGLFASEDGSIWKTHPAKPGKLIHCYPWIRGPHIFIIYQKHQLSVRKLIADAFLGPKPPGTKLFNFPDRSLRNCAANNLCYARTSDLFHCPRCRTAVIPPHRSFCIPCKAAYDKDRSRWPSYRRSERLRDRRRYKAKLRKSRKIHHI